MAKTVWTPVTTDVTWLMPDLTVIPTPQLEMSGSGRRVRIAGSKQSFGRAEMYYELQARLGAWGRVRPTPAEGSFGKNNSGIFAVTLTYTAQDVPLWFRMTVRMIQDWQDAFLTVEIEPMVARFAGDRWADLTKTEIVGKSPLLALKAGWAFLKGLDNPVEVRSPDGTPVWMYPTDKSIENLRTALTWLSEWADMKQDLTAIQDAYLTFRSALSMLGLVLPAVKDDDMMRLLRGEVAPLRINTTSSQFADQQSGGISYDPMTGMFHASHGTQISEATLKDWVAIQQLAKLQGQERTFHEFAMAHVHAMAVETHKAGLQIHEGEE